MAADCLPEVVKGGWPFCPTAEAGFVVFWASGSAWQDPIHAFALPQTLLKRCAFPPDSILHKDNSQRRQFGLRFASFHDLFLAP
jgi:hypothetical protein